MNKPKNEQYIKLIVILVLALVVFLVRNAIIEKQRLKERQETIKALYINESSALCLDRYDCYMDFSHVQINTLTLNIAAYRYFESDAPNLTVDDVREYLSNEFDENGEPCVLNIPENIVRYINWYNLFGGNRNILDYIVFLRNYQDNNEEYKDFDKFNGDIDTLNKLIEDFENCPDKDKYTF